MYYRVEVEMISPTCPLTLGSHPQVCCTLPGSEGAETIFILTFSVDCFYFFLWWDVDADMIDILECNFISVLWTEEKWTEEKKTI